MAPVSDRSGKRRDRLERFFKRSTNPANTMQGSTSRGSIPAANRALEQFTFPEPPFRRPRSTRMLARDELALASQSAGRSKSLPEPLSTQQRYSTESATRVSMRAFATSLLDDFPEIPSNPQHGVPFVRRSARQSLAAFLDYSFSGPSRMSANGSSSSSGSVIRIGSRSRSGLTSIPLSPSELPDRKHDLASVDEPGSADQEFTPDTPPPSAQNESFPASPTSNHRRQLPSISPLTNLTPEPSPQLPLYTLSSLPDLEFDDLRLDDIIQVGRPRSVDEPSSVKTPCRSLRKSASESTLLASLILQIDKVLKEPSLADFLTLSDEDIADGNPVPPPMDTMVPKPLSCARPSALPPCFRPPSPFDDYPLLTLSPPLVTKPAAAAAFEAARIAIKYRFDFVYVVSLWPRQTRRQMSASEASSPPTPLSSSLFSPNNSSRCLSTKDMDKDVPLEHNHNTALTGRLLAAYGLQSIARPFRIDMRVHQKVLAADGWLEYRSDTPLQFSRGYSCAFYPSGCTPRGGYSSVINANEDKAFFSEGTGQEPQPVPNRGIVFAAYRMPLPDGTNIPTDTAELASLQEEAGQLVDMLIDCQNCHVKPKARRKGARGRRDSTRAKTLSTDDVVLAA